MSGRIPAKVSREFRADRIVPECPHCGGSMAGAFVALEDIALHGIPDRVPCFDGYARSHEGPRVLCHECLRISVLAIDAMSIKLVAARTMTDEAVLAACRDGERP